MSMVERRLYRIIEAGLDWFKADDGQRFERFMASEQGMDLSAAEAAKARVYFAGGTIDGTEIEARPPTLVHGYARQGGPFPCWALTLGSERTASAYIGDDAPMLDEDGGLYYDPETGDVVDPKERRMAYTFNILTIADHPDVTVWYYQLLKSILMSRYRLVPDNELDDLDLSGQDMAPDPRFLPSDVFARVLTVSIEYDECWTEAIIGGGGTSVGIAIDDTGEGSTAGDAAGSVTANVTPYDGSE